MTTSERPAGQSIQIGDHSVGVGHSVFTIAEVGLAHDGSLGMAHAYIDAIAKTGASAVKFQTHIASAESTAKEQFRVRVFPQDETRFDYWTRTGFEKSQWRELAAHATESGLLFLSSPFSEQAVEWLRECNVPAWKVASGELTNHSLLAEMAATGKPILFSSGMSSWSELDAAIAIARKSQTEFGVFQCTTAYPCPPEKWGLNVIDQLRQRYQCPVGLSDHSGTIAPGLAAVTLGANMLEFHVVFHTAQFGPDTKASIPIERVPELIDSVNAIQTAMKHPLDKDTQAKELEPLHRLFTKSVVAANSLARGHVIRDEDLTFKKPGTGWPADDATSLHGRVLLRDVEADHFFCVDDFESSDRD